MIKVPVKPMMALSGVRNSWLIVARKRSLAWLAFSNSMFFSCNVRSKRLRSVMSRMELLTSVPSSVSSGLRLISTGNSVPSLRRPKSSRPAPIGRTFGSSKNRPRWPGCLALKRSGTSISIGCSSNRARVSEQLFGLGVDQNDFPGAVDDDHGVGGGFQQGPKLLFRFLAFADVPDGAHRQRAFLGLQGAKTDFNGKLCSI